MHGALRRRYVPCDGVLDCRDIRPDQLHVRLQKLVLTSKYLVRWGIGNLLCKMQGT